MMQQPKPEPDQPQKCPYVVQDFSTGYLVCKASKYGTRTPEDLTPEFRPINREEIALCCSLSHLQCPDYRKAKRAEEVKKK
jgi:hypothetical protein